MEIVGLGAGGHAKVVIEILQRNATLRIIGLLDRDDALWGRQVLGIPVLGGDDLLPELYGRGVRHVFIGVGSTGDATTRRLLYEQARASGFTVASAVHPSAVVSPSAALGAGVALMANAVVNAGADVAENVIVNTGAIVEHDCALGPHCHIAVGARLCSGVRVGAAAHIGAGATIRQGIAIGEGAVVGAGAVVVKDVPPGTTVIGVPAQVLRRAEL